MACLNVYYCYALLQSSNEEPFYIGKGKGSRAHQHINHSYRGRTHKDRRIQKLLREGEPINVVILVEGLLEEEAHQIERVLIQLIGRKPNGPLLNMTDGGEGVSGLVFTEKHRMLIREAGRKPCKEETKSKIRKTLTGRVHSEETKKKLKKIMNEKAGAIRDKLVGRKLTKEHLNNSTAAQRRRWEKKTERELASARAKLQWQDPAYREKQSLAHKKI